MRIFWVITVAVLLHLSAPPPASAQSAQQLFQQALSKERAEGNLEEAIQLYRRVIAAAGADRALVSRALLQVGRCYEKLGQSGARESYERLLRDYADQTSIASEAKARLAALARPAAPSRPAITIRQLSMLGLGNDLQAMSPDGTKAVIGDYSKGQNLAVFDFTSKQSRLLTDYDWTDFWAYYGRWSPDGKQIAYMRAGWKADSVAELRIVGLAGESRTVFRHLPASPFAPAAWTPDGGSLLITLRQADGATAMGLVGIADARFTTLKTFGPAASPDPALSPDGRLVAFVDSASGAGELHVMSVDGTRSFRVTDHPASDHNPVWSPDGRHIAFISNRFGADALWAVAIEGSGTHGEPFKIRDGMRETRLLEWSSRGIAATQFIRTSDLYTIGVDAATARTTGKPQALAYLRSGQNNSPVWSPDGASLAFVSTPASDSRTRYVVVRTPAGRPREFLIPTPHFRFPGEPQDLRWFGNGRGLGFSGLDEKGKPAVFRLSLDTGQWTVGAMPTKAWTRIEWNDDGTAYYYARHSFAEPNGGIFERGFDSGQERRVYEMPQGMRSARALVFSPDRKWLAFVEGGTETTGVIVLDMASGETRTLATMKDASMTPASGRLTLSGWSPDGRVLVQRIERAGANAEWLLHPVDGGEPARVMFDIPASPGAADLPALTPTVTWSPDGSTLVFVRTRFSGGSFIIENPLADAQAPAAGNAARR